MQGSLKSRLLFLTGILLFIMGSTNIFSIYKLAIQNQATREISETWLPMVGKSSDLNINVANYRRLELALLATQSTDERKSIIDEMDGLSGNITIYSKVLEPYLVNESLQKTYTSFQDNWEKYTSENEKFRAAIDKEDTKSAEQILTGDSEKFYKASNDALKSLSDTGYMTGIGNAESVSKSFKLTLWLLVGAMAIGLISGVVISFYVIRGLQSSLNGIAQGLDTSSSVIREKSDELFEANEKISSNATTTAASLEELVASMEELTSTVKQNSQSSTTAAQLSKDGQLAVEGGQRKINNLIEVMVEISKNSKKIEEIITLIEDIAFQTNLLALNAAVEAARAGEQGRGFAVVADAVRLLAQKSAGAAKEISSLINSASEKSTEGVRLAGESGDSLKEIVSSVEKVSVLIQQVADGSYEQADGIEQMNKALTEIDQSMQSIASSLSNVSSSTSEMQNQSDGLSRMMTDLRKLVSAKKKSKWLSFKKNNENKNQQPEGKQTFAA